ncbi:MAG TPA: ParA family protein [Anaerolineaceae bacterium]|nr:ParA family protein [Anaerolineaceae bacterium]
MCVIAIANQKGGVGKTTTTTSLAHWFALHDRRVLVLDLDGQGHVGPALGLEKADGLYQLIVRERPITEVAIEARAGLHVVLNDHTCEMAKEHIKQANFREYLLDSVLEDARAQYDIILLDTPPSTDVLHVLALVASDWLVIPANMDYLALDGVGYVLKTLKALARYPNVVAPILVGILPTLYDKTTNETIRNIRDLQASIGADRILPPIPRDTKIREAAARGITIWEHALRSQAAEGFENGSRARNSRGKVGGYLHLAEIMTDLIRGGAK